MFPVYPLTYWWLDPTVSMIYQLNQNNQCKNYPGNVHMYKVRSICSSLHKLIIQNNNSEYKALHWGHAPQYHMQVLSTNQDNMKQSVQRLSRTSKFCSLHKLLIGTWCLIRYVGNLAETLVSWLLGETLNKFFLTIESINCSTNTPKVLVIDSFL